MSDFHYLLPKTLRNAEARGAVPETDGIFSVEIQCRIWFRHFHNELGLAAFSMTRFFEQVSEAWVTIFLTILYWVFETDFVGR